jgi:hypothetical protein
VAAVPENHMIIYGDLARPGTAEAMRAFAAEVMRSGPRPISSTLFLWTPGGWHPLVFVPTR